MAVLQGCMMEERNRDQHRPKSNVLPLAIGHTDVSDKDDAARRFHNCPANQELYTQYGDVGKLTGEGYFNTEFDDDLNFPKRIDFNTQTADVRKGSKQIQFNTKNDDTIRCISQSSRNTETSNDTRRTVQRRDVITKTDDNLRKRRESNSTTNTDDVVRLLDKGAFNTKDTHLIRAIQVGNFYTENNEVTSDIKSDDLVDETNFLRRVVQQGCFNTQIDDVISKEANINTQTDDKFGYMRQGYSTIEVDSAQQGNFKIKNEISISVPMQRNFNTQSDDIVNWLRQENINPQNDEFVIGPPETNNNITQNFNLMGVPGQENFTQIHDVIGSCQKRDFNTTTSNDVLCNSKQKYVNIQTHDVMGSPVQGNFNTQIHDVMGNLDTQPDDVPRYSGHRNLNRQNEDMPRVICDGDFYNLYQNVMVQHKPKREPFGHHPSHYNTPRDRVNRVCQDAIIRHFQPETLRSLGHSGGHANSQRAQVELPVWTDLGLPEQVEKVEDVVRMVVKFPVVEVCGAPCVGKSTIVRQAMHRVMARSVSLLSTPRVDVRHISCKGLTSVEQVFHILSQELGTRQPLNRYNASPRVSDLLGGDTPSRDTCIILVFHGCEMLCQSAMQYQFIDLLCQISLGDARFKSVFTTYKSFPLSSDVGRYQVNMMTTEDIRRFLQFYLGSGEVNVESYVLVIVRYNLCFPLGVRHLVWTFLSNPLSRPDAEGMERLLSGDSFQFLMDMFRHRVKEVDFWLDTSDHSWMEFCCHSLDAFITDKLLEELQQSYEKVKHQVDVLVSKFALIHISALKCLRFHPLLVLHFMVQRRARKGVIFDHTCGKIVQFFCHVLSKTEAMTESVGFYCGVVQCLLPEWSNLKNTIQMAVFCTGNSYRDFLKVALRACHLLVKYFPVESIEFFDALHRHSLTLGTERERAILKELLAFACFAGKPNHWAEADELFRSSLRVLGKEKSFYAAQTCLHYARTLGFNSKFEKALHFYEKGIELIEGGLEEEEEELFFFTQERVIDLEMRLRINVAYPLMSLGESKKANKTLHLILQGMEHEGRKDLSEMQFLYNLLAMSESKAYNNDDMAIVFHKQSLKWRKLFRRLNPKEIALSCNMLAEHLTKKGRNEEAIRLLEEALEARRCSEYVSYYTARTWQNLSEIHLKTHNLCLSLKEATEADQILTQSCKNHEYWLRMTHHLGHLRWALDQELDKAKRSQNHPRGLQLVDTIASSKTVVQYLQSVFRLAEDRQDGMGDNSHAFLLSSLEHLILFNWGEEEKVKEYVKKMEHVMTSYPLLVQEVKRSRQGLIVNPVLKSHLDLYFELVERMKSGSYFEHFEMFLSKVVTNCEHCALTSEYFSENVWRQHCDSLVGDRGRQKVKGVLDSVINPGMPQLPKAVSCSEFINRSSVFFEDFPQNLHQKQKHENQKKTFVSNANESSQNLIMTKQTEVKKIDVGKDTFILIADNNDDENTDVKRKGSCHSSAQCFLSSNNTNDNVNKNRRELPYNLTTAHPFLAINKNNVTSVVRKDNNNICTDGHSDDNNNNNTIMDNGDNFDKEFDSWNPSPFPSDLSSERESIVTQKESFGISEFLEHHEQLFRNVSDSFPSDGQFSQHTRVMCRSQGSSPRKDNENINVQANLMETTANFHVLCNVQEDFTVEKTQYPHPVVFSENTHPEVKQMFSTETCDQRLANLQETLKNSKSGPVDGTKQADNEIVRRLTRKVPCEQDERDLYKKVTK